MNPHFIDKLKDFTKDEEAFRQMKEMLLAYTATKNWESEFGNSLLEAVPIPIILSDLKTGIIYSVNKHSESFFEISRDTAIGMKVTEFYANQEDRAEVLSVINQNKVIENVQLNLKTYSGRVISTLVSSRILNLNNSEILITSVNNISKQIESEKKLTNVNTLLKQAQSIAGLHIITLDFHNNIFITSEQSKEHFQLKEKKGDLLSFFDLFDEESKTKILEFLNERKEKILKINITHLLSNRIYEILIDLNYQKTEYIVFIMLDITERVQIEQQLKENEARYRSLTNATQEAVCLIENGRVLDVNPALTRLWGYTEEELFGHRPSEFIHEDDADLVLKNIVNQSTEPYEAKCVRKDGSIFIGEILSRMYESDNRTIRVTTIRDITDKKLAAQKINTTLKNLDIIIKNIPTPFFVKNRKHEWVQFNKKFSDLMSHNPNDILGKSDYDFFPKEDADNYWKNDDYVFETKESISLQERLVDKNGKVRTIITKKVFFQDAEGEDLILGNITDITEILETTNKLRKNEEFLQMIMKNVPEILYAFDINGIFTLSVGKNLQKLGLKDNEVVGKSLFELYKHNQVVIDTHKKVLEGESSTYKSKEKDFFFESYIKPLYNEKGHIIGGIGTAIDISEREAALNALIDSEANYRDLFNSSVMAILVHKDGVVIDTNKTLEELFGYTANEVIGTSIFDYIPKEEHQNVMLHTLEEAPRYITKGFKRNGNIFPMELYVKNINYKGMQCRIAMFQDISDRFEAEQRIRASEAMLSEAQHIGKIGSWEYYPDTKQVKCSEELFRIHDMDIIEDVKIEEIVQYYNEESQSLIYSSLEKLSLKRKEFDIVLSMHSKNGRHKWVRSIGKPIIDKKNQLVKAIGIIQDITEKHNAQIEIIEKDAQIQIAFESAGLMLYEIDIEKEKIIFSPKLRDFYEIDHKSQIDFYSTAQYVYPEDAERVSQSFYQHLNGLSTFYNEEHRVVTSKGKIKWVATAARVIAFDKNGKATRVIGISRDITDRKEKEEALIKLNEELSLARVELEDRVSERTLQLNAAYEQLQAMLKKEKSFNEMQEKFVSLISHEFRTPLTVVLSYSNLLASAIKNNRTLTTEQLIKLTNGIDDSSQQMTGILDSITQLIQLQKTTLSENPIAMEMKKVFEFLQKDILQMSQFAMRTHFDIEKRDCKVLISEYLLNNAMRRILNNAYQYSTPDTDVWVKSYISEGKYKISITNNGEVISEKDRDSIFDLFKRGTNQEAKGQHRGLGVGLAVAKMCITALDGEITFESKDEQTEFLISLPILKGIDD